MNKEQMKLLSKCIYRTEENSDPYQSGALASWGGKELNSVSQIWNWWVRQWLMVLCTYRTANRSITLENMWATSRHSTSTHAFEKKSLPH